MFQKLKKTRLAGFIILSTIVLLANSSNPPNGRTGAPGDGVCSSCHGGSNSSLDGEVMITGLPASIVSNTTYPITVTVNNPNGNGVEGGFQWVALNASNINVGTMSNPDANSSISMFSGRAYHEHQPAQPFDSGNSISYTVDWTAPNGPDGETITFYGAGLISNGNGSTSGDRARYTSVSGTLTGASTLDITAVKLNDASCNGASDGSAEATATGGAPPYSFVWGNGETTAIATNLSAGVHTVSVTDNLNVTESTTVSIAQPLPLGINIIGISNEDCLAGNGSATVMGTNGTQPYTYLWSNGDTGASLNNVSSGTYGITVTDSNMCTGSSSVTIDKNNSNLGINLVQQDDLDCFGDDDGFLNVIASNSVGSVVYSWSHGFNGAQQSGLTAGSYIVTATDALGCQGTSEFQISQPDSIEINIIEVQPDVCGNMNGAIEVFVSGGMGTLDLDWSNGDTGTQTTGLSAGTYEITVTDDNFCEAELEIIVPENSGNIIVDTLNIVDPLCFEDNTGIISVLATNGTGLYSYAWSNGDSTSTIFNLEDGMYHLSVTDALGCSFIDSFELNNPIPLFLDLFSTPATCNGINNGFIDSTFVGGTGPLTLTWGHGSDRFSLAPGTYTATVTDSLGCMISDTVEVGAENVLTASSVVTDILCFNDENGAIDLSTQGTSGPVAYTWSTGQTTEDIDSLEAGYYSVLIIDSLECIIEVDSILVDQPDTLLILPSVVQIPGCNGQTLGTVTALPLGGTMPYDYLWSNQMIEDTINVMQGMYSVTVTDQNDCTASASIVLSNTDNGLPTIVAQDFSLYLDSMGMTSMVDTSMFDLGSFDDCELLGFTYDPGPFDCVQDSILFPIQLEDLSGNIAYDTLLITLLDSIKPEILCANDFVSFECDSAHYEIPTASDNCSVDLELISGPASGELHLLGDYTVVYQATDQYGNTAQCSFDVTVENSIDYEVETTDVSCFNFQDGSVNITSSSSAGLTSVIPVNYDPQFIEAGSYDFMILDEGGCVVNDSFEIFEPPVLLISDFTVLNSTTSNSMDGSIDITASGGAPTYSYEWYLNGSLLSMEEDLNNLAPGEYTCIVTDQNGCTYESIVFVVEATTSNNEVLANEISVYPNPAGEFVFIDLSQGNFIPNNIGIYDLTGRLLYQQNPSDSLIKINVQDFNSGIYLIKVSHQNQEWAKKLIINN